MQALDLFDSFDPATVAAIERGLHAEQTAIHCSDDLHSFYREFFHGLRSIDKHSARQAR